MAEPLNYVCNPTPTNRRASLFIKLVEQCPMQIFAMQMTVDIIHGVCLIMFMSVINCGNNIWHINNYVYRSFSCN